MGEEAQVKSSGAAETPKPDLTLFRVAQRDVGETAERPELFEEVVNDDIKASIGNDGKVDKSLLETVNEYIDIVKEPYSVNFYKADAIYNSLTEGDFELIDKYVLEKIEKSNKKSTFDVYEKILTALEDILNISDDHNTMHRITTVVKFIKHGT